jgi:hypothetical protein
MSSDNQLRYHTERLDRLEGHTGIQPDDGEPGWWGRLFERMDSAVTKWLHRMDPTLDRPRVEDMPTEPEIPPTVPSHLPLEVRAAHLREKGKPRPTPFKRPSDYDQPGIVTRTFGDREFTFREGSGGGDGN